MQRTSSVLLRRRRRGGVGFFCFFGPPPPRCRHRDLLLLPSAFCSSERSLLRPTSSFSSFSSRSRRNCGQQAPPGYDQSLFWTDSSRKSCDISSCRRTVVTAADKDNGAPQSLHSSSPAASLTDARYPPYVSGGMAGDSSNDNNQSASSASVKYHEPFTNHQKGLLDYTQSILPSTESQPIGTLSYAQLVQISNCIHQWISTGEHRYLGAEQAERLMKRLILERGGGRSLLKSERRTGGGGETTPRGASGASSDLRKNEDVTWEMYQFFPVVQYLNALYDGKEFVDRVMSIVATFDEEYVNDHDDDDDADVDEGYLEVPYKSMISCLCDRRTPHAAAAAERILHRFESKLREGKRTGAWHHSNPPGVETYNSILTAWNTAGGEAYARHPHGTRPPYEHHANPCSNLLCEMLERYESAAPGEDANRLRPDFVTFNTAITSLAKEQSNVSWGGNGGGAGNNNNNDDGEYHRSVGGQCHRHLASMLKLHEEGHGWCAPDLITFSTVINALGRGRDRGDEGRAREVLDTMLRLSGSAAAEEGPGDRNKDDYDFDVVPRNKHFNVVLALMARSNRRGDVKTLEDARRYVDVMERLGKEEKEREVGNGEDGNGGGGFSWSKPQTHNEKLMESESSSSTMSMMEDILMLGEEKTEQEVEEKEKKRNERVILSMKNSAPDIITYNTLLNIAARAGRPETAEEILEGMIRNSKDGGDGVKPDNVSFNTVLSAWSKSKGAKGKLRTEQLLHRMQEMADKGDSDVRPDRASVTTVITAMTSAARSDRMAPIKAERIVDQMEVNEEKTLRPDVVTYTSLIRCWTESGRSRAADRAEEIIKTLHQRYDEGHAECKPDTLVYNVAMNALAKSEAPNCAERAEALLNRMHDHYHAGDSDLVPTTQSFSTAIQAWARSDDPRGALKAEKLLRTMHDLEESGNSNVAPNTIAYSTCILAWRNSRRNDAGNRAEALLEKMEGYQDGGLTHLKPNAIAYTNAMEAWISCRQPESLERVESILERMIERSKRGNGYSDSAPTTTTLNVVMKAIQHSSHQMKHEKAEQLLNHMKKMHEGGDKRIKPSILTYNTFFSACAMTEGDRVTRMAAFTSLVHALIELNDHKYLRPDAYTWPAVWKACQNQLDVKNDFAWINRIFELTIKSGYVNEYLFNNIRGFLPPQYLQKKLKTKQDVHRLTVHDLPPDWTCNVKIGRNRKGGGRAKHQ